MLVKSFEQVELGILLNLDAKVIELFNRGIAGQEIRRARAEADDLQIRQRRDCTCNGYKFMNHIGALLRSSDGVLRNICLNIAQRQIVAGIQHAAVSVSASADQASLRGLLSCSHEHFRTVKMLCKKCFRDLGTKVPKIDNKGIAAGFLNIRKCLKHMHFALDDADRAFIDIRIIVFFPVSFHQGFSSRDRKGFRKTVAANRNDTDFYYRHDPQSQH